MSQGRLAVAPRVTVIPNALLAGLPTEAPVYSTSGDTDRITALARALGISGSVHPTARQRTVGTGSRTMHVQPAAGLPWYVGPASDGTETIAVAAAVVSEPAMVLADRTDGSAGTAAARAAAQRVLDALALSATFAVDVRARNGGTLVTAAPVLGGVPTIGYDVRLTITAGGTVTDAVGQLARPVRTATCRLLDPRAAVARDAAYRAAHPYVVTPMGPTPMPPATPPPPPRVVTAVRLGLTYEPPTDAAAPGRLVPVWLLSFADTPYPDQVRALAGHC